MNKREELAGCFYLSGGGDILIVKEKFDNLLNAILHKNEFALNLVAEKPVRENIVETIPVIDKNVGEGQSSGRDEVTTMMAESTNEPKDSQPLADTLLVFDDICSVGDTQRKCPECNSSWQCQRYLENVLNRR